MAKSQRSKYKKRLRSAKAAHHYEIKGKAALERINARMNDPNYQMASEYALPVNAYLEPDNPLAVFPQVKKPDILDFRSHRMAGGSQAAIGVFRKHLAKGQYGNIKKSKYDTVVKTTEMLEAEEAGAAAAMQEETEMIAVESAVATKDSMAELSALTEKMTLDKKAKIRARKAKGKGDDVEMSGDVVPKIQIKSNAIKKTQR